MNRISPYNHGNVAVRYRRAGVPTAQSTPACAIFGDPYSHNVGTSAAGQRQKAYEFPLSGAIGVGPHDLGATAWVLSSIRLRIESIAKF